MNFSEALTYLEQVHEKGTKLALDNIQKIIDNLPISLDNIKFIQVAGTNGKGSTSHYLTSILKESGFKTGMFTSPHLQDLRERITINKEWISEQDFADSILKVTFTSHEAPENDYGIFYSYGRSFVTLVDDEGENVLWQSEEEKDGGLTVNQARGKVNDKLLEMMEQDKSLIQALSELDL